MTIPFSFFLGLWIGAIAPNSAATVGTSCVVHRTDSLQQH